MSWELPGGGALPRQKIRWRPRSAKLREEGGYRAGRLEFSRASDPSPAYLDETGALLCRAGSHARPPPADDDEFFERRIVPFAEALRMVLADDHGVVLEGRHSPVRGDLQWPKVLCVSAPGVLTGCPAGRTPEAGSKVYQPRRIRAAEYREVSDMRTVGRLFIIASDALSRRWHSAARERESEIVIAQHQRSRIDRRRLPRHPSAPALRYPPGRTPTSHPPSLPRSERERKMFAWLLLLLKEHRAALARARFQPFSGAPSKSPGRPRDRARRPW